ncbi:MAG: N-acetylmuramoyl-L-alanine amidase, partial [Deltaproteobacteria bacterium]|nr:N-acetylmuramoyl-L-alanine amidase [Deltaproteobacteria bacterium]
MKYRENWLACINKFNAVYRHNPSGPWAPAGLYMSGRLYAKLYKYSYKKSDKKEAIDIFKRIIKRFPKSRYRTRARSAIITLTGQSAKKKSSVKKTRKKKKPYYSTVKVKKIIRAEKKSGLSSNFSRATITGLRFWSNRSYTRIVVDADKETAYIHRLLKKDPSIKKPQRLYLDLDNSRLKQGIAQTIPINDNLLKNARAAQYNHDSVRVAIDIKSFKTYKIFSLKNPFRIVIDVWGRDINKTYPKPFPVLVKKNTGVSPGTLAKQLALGVRRIVIDPGHGGRDYGAPGYLKGVHEKNIALQIAKKLAKKIRAKLHCEVIMTRKDDRYLTLEERT